MEKEIIINRMKAVRNGEYNSNKCIACQKEIENVEDENMSIEFTDKNGNKKTIVYPVCDDCKIDVVKLFYDI